MNELDELIRRLEAATESSREFDAAIYKATTREPTADEQIARARQALGREPSDAMQGMFRGSEEYALANPRPYTTSLDAALTLVPEGMPIDVHIGPRGRGNDATVYQPVKSLDDQGRRVTTYVPHEAKAVREGTMHWNPAPVQLCIAALRAREAIK